MHWIIVILLSNGVQMTYNMPDYQTCAQQVKNITIDGKDKKLEPLAFCAQIPWGKEQPNDPAG